MLQRRRFENLAPALKTVISRKKRGDYEKNRRPTEPVIRDGRGRVVRSVGKAQTFLSEVQIDEIVGLYKGGLSMNKIAEMFGAHKRTIAAHLVRRSVPLRLHQTIAADDTAEAVRLYESGMTLLAVGRRFGVSQQAARTAIAGAGATIRPRGVQPAGTSLVDPHSPGTLVDE